MKRNNSFSFIVLCSFLTPTNYLWFFCMLLTKTWTLLPSTCFTPTLPIDHHPSSGPSSLHLSPSCTTWSPQSFLRAPAVSVLVPLSTGIGQLVEEGLFIRSSPFSTLCTLSVYKYCWPSPDLSHSQFYPRHSHTLSTHHVTSSVLDLPQQCIHSPEPSECSSASDGAWRRRHPLETKTPC